MVFTQDGFDIRCEWGAMGVEQFAPKSDVIVIVDVLSFSTCVDIVTERGGIVFPFGSKDESPADYATQHDALLASRDRKTVHGYSLSPTSLLKISAETRIVLPSPNGSTLSRLTGSTPTYCACLRNAKAVAEHIQAVDGVITVIPAGERWKTDYSLRPSLEDLIGAGAVIHYLVGTKSPEAQIAEMTFLQFKGDLMPCFEQIGSGRELIEKGFQEDVALATQLHVSQSVAFLQDNQYINIGHNRT